MAWALQAAWAWLLWGITVLKLISGFLSSWGKKYLISKVIVHIIQVLKFTSTALQSAPLKTFPLQGGYLPFFSLIFGSLYFLTLFPSLITVDHDLLFWFSIALSSVNELHCALVFWFKFSLKLFILISSAVGLTALSCATDFTPSDGKEGIYSREISPENSVRFSSVIRQQPCLLVSPRGGGGGLAVCPSYFSCVAACPEIAATLLLPLQHVDVASMVYAAFTPSKQATSTVIS